MINESKLAALVQSYMAEQVLEDRLEYAPEDLQYSEGLTKEEAVALYYMIRGAAAVK